MQKKYIQQNSKQYQLVVGEDHLLQLDPHLLAMDLSSDLKKMVQNLIVMLYKKCLYYSFTFKATAMANKANMGEYTPNPLVTSQVVVSQNIEATHSKMSSIRGISELKYLKI